jgi:hypothetical protein
MEFTAHRLDYQKIFLVIKPPIRDLEGAILVKGETAIC